MTSGMLKDTIDQYTIRCIRCGATRGLRMISHRADNDLMVGWIFACQLCEESLYNSRVLVGDLDSDDIARTLFFLESLGEAAKGETLYEKVTHIVSYYAAQVGRLISPAWGNERETFDYERQVAEETRKHDRILFPGDDPEEVVG